MFVDWDLGSCKGIGDGEVVWRLDWIGFLGSSESSLANLERDDDGGWGGGGGGKWPEGLKAMGMEGRSGKGVELDLQRMVAWTCVEEICLPHRE